jgi:CheY-like chemotaxis protein
MRVLIADDNRDAADTLAMIVRLWGHEALVVYDGASALTVARPFKPDVMLLDIQMPRVNGGDVALYLRQQVGFERIKFIALSANDPNDERLADYRDAFDVYLSKPCDLDQLHDLLSSRTSSGGCTYNSTAGVR